MNDPIRITHRVETTFEIEGPAGLAGLAFPFAAAASAIAAPKATPEPELVPGEPTDLQEALQAISLNLGCANTLDDMLHAIDALRGPQLEWSPTLADGERVDFKDAEAAIATLNASLPAGEAQWRMPSRRELESIQDLTKHNPCVDIEKYPDTKPGYYWSSTPCAWSSDRAWFVGFDGGVSYDLHRGSNFAFVRAVRAVPSGQ